MPYLIAFFATVLLEFLVIFLFIRKKPKILFLGSLAINSITWPAANIVYNYFWHNLLVIELLVFLVESVLLVIILKIKLPKALAVSFFANLITALAGFIIF